MNVVIEPTQPFASAPPILSERVNGQTSHNHWQNGLAKRFTLREPEEVFIYLNQHPMLVPLIFEAGDKALKYFAELHALALHLAEYPNDGSRELFLLIQTAQAPDAALTQMDRFDQEWWLDAQDRAEGRLNVKLEYL
jgi:hypothetical protein